MSVTSNTLSLEELNCIMNLQRQEAFDDSNNNNNNNNNKNKDRGSKNGYETPEDKLLQILEQQTKNINRESSSSQNKGGSRQHRSSYHAGESSSRRPSSRPKSSRTLSAPDDQAAERGRRQSSSAAAPRPHRVPTKGSEYNSSKEKRGESSRKVRKSPSLEHYDDKRGREKRDGPRPSSGRRPRRHSRADSSDDKRRRSSSLRGLRKPDDSKNNSYPKRSYRSDISIDAEKSTTSMSSAERRLHLMRQQRKSTSDILALSPTGIPEKTKSMREQLLSQRIPKEWNEDTQAVGMDTNQTFENLWGKGDGIKARPTVLGGFLGHVPPSPRKLDSDVKSVGDDLSRNTLTTQETSGDGVKRKTKLDKIHELQAKCERYKKEWIEVTKGKKIYRKELEENKKQVASLTKEIDTNLVETATLKKNLSESINNLDRVQNEQRKERTDFSNSAKELAEARIDHAKALNETREHRAELDDLEKKLSEKDTRISILVEDLQISKEKADDLDKDVAFAENEIIKLEDDLHKLEDELIAYRTAAEKDADPDGSSGNLQKAREAMEQKLHEERERRLEEKQQKLEEKIRQFEEEREKFLEKEKERDLDQAERERQDGKKQKERDEERQRMDGEIHQRLKELGDDNTVLQGRLKQEQLVTAAKIKRKDELIEGLQKELADVKKQLSERDADPNGVAALQKEVETAKAEASTTRDDLEDALKHNGILEEEIEDLQTACQDLRTEIASLKEQFATTKKESENWKKKAEEWQTKSGEWSDKAFQWKDKAEHWENRAKELDPDAAGEPSSAPAKADPQALFLQAALQKRNVKNNPMGSSTRNFFGGLFNKPSEDEDEASVRMQELQEENNKQAEIIKNLRSEMVKMQTMFKEEAYSKQQEIQAVRKEKEAVELKNTNLMKELELARKLESLTNRDD